MRRREERVKPEIGLGLGRFRASSVMEVVEAVSVEKGRGWQGGATSELGSSQSSEMVAAFSPSFLSPTSDARKGIELEGMCWMSRKSWLMFF
jgi:hypothetical protein